MRKFLAVVMLCFATTVNAVEVPQWLYDYAINMIKMQSEEILQLKGQLLVERLKFFSVCKP